MNLTEKIKELREKTGAGMMDCKKALEENNNDIEASIKWLREKGIAKAAKKENRVTAEGVVATSANDNSVVLFEVNSETDFVAKNETFLELIDIIGNILLNNNVNSVEEALNVSYNNGTLKDYITEKIATIGEKITLRRFEKYSKADNQSLGYYIHANKRVGVTILFNGQISNEDAKQLAMHITAMSPKFLSREHIDQDYLKSEHEILTNEAKNDPKNQGKPDNILEKMVEGRLNKQLAEVCLVDQVFVIDPNLKVKDWLKQHNVEVIKFTRFEVGEGIQKEEVDFASEVMAQIKQ